MSEDEDALYCTPDDLPYTPKVGALEDGRVSQVCGKFAKGAPIRYTKANTRTI